MAKIEISLNEYNGLKSKIKELEENNVNISKENDILKEKLNTIEDSIFDLEEEPLFNRIFSWKKIIKQISNLF